MPLGKLLQLMRFAESRRLCISLLLLECALAHRLSSYEKIVTIQGDASTNQADSCSFAIDVSEDQAILQVWCDNVELEYEYSVEQNLGVGLTQHEFVIVDKNDNNKVGILACQAGRGIKWELQLNEIQLNESETALSINATLEQNRDSMTLLYGMFALVTAILLPPRARDENMKEVNVYSFCASIQLSFAIAANLITVIAKFIQNSQVNMVSAVSVCILIASGLAILVQLNYKVRGLRLMLKSSRRDKTAQITFWLCIGICILAIPIMITMRKTIFTSLYFASGLIIYMSSFILSPNASHLGFSFRFVALDAVGILLLGLSSRLYPILFYQIPNLYHLIGTLLMEAVLILYATITHILVNVIGKEIRERKREAKMHQIMESTTSDSSLREHSHSISRSMRRQTQQQKIQQEVNHQFTFPELSATSSSQMGLRQS